MPQRRNVLRIVLLTIPLLSSQFVWGAEDNSEVHSSVSRMATYKTAAGEQFFALSIQPKAQDAAAVASATAQGRTIVVLVDTSASQIGDFRVDSLHTLDAMLGNLEPQDRVQLLAIDGRTAEMSQGFLAVGSEPLNAGVTKLRRRVPLGSTDLVGGLQDALDRIPNGQIGAVVYIGDGMSHAGEMKSTKFSELIDRFVARKVSVTSFAIGPQRNVLSLSILANHTGGQVFIDSVDSDSEHFGVLLARSIRGQIFWPKQVEFAAGVREVYPAKLPPLRSDRDTIVVGVLEDNIDVEVNVKFHGGVAASAFQFQPEPSNPDFAFLPQIVSVAKLQGLMPTTGSNGLREAAGALTANSRQLTSLARVAIAHGDAEGAKKVLEAALRRDPHNVEAGNALLGVNRFGEKLKGEPIMRLVAQNQGGAAGTSGADDTDAGSLLEQFENAAGKELKAFQDANSVREQQIRTEVESSIRAARKKTERDATSAVDDLKLLLDSVMNLPDVSASVRAQLRRRVESAMRSASTQAIVQQDNQAEAERHRLAGQEATRIADETLRREETIKELMAQFASLMDEGRYEAADDDVAQQVREMAPDLPDAMTATWSARFHRQVAGMERFREMRHKNYADAMYAVEALIPFPDRDPIVYPSPEFWQDITRKRARYKSMDLSGDNPAENRIYDALEKVENLPLLDTTLEELAAFLYDNFGINAIVDEKALEDDAIPIDTQVTSNLSGMRLKTALRLTLRKHDLTYIIDDEVLQITTQTAAAEKQITRVYPVGDLVIAPMSFGGQGGGGFGGQGGQGGGGGGFGGGGQGGGGGGFGGGQGGGGGGFGGGGQFNVEDVFGR